MKNTFQKGAISVFLAIILVPCIVVSGTFVDLSRVKLSKGAAVSAADLSLNSLMTNYDVDLNEIYGMMASCQTIEEFYEESAQFFLDALYSQGLEADEIDSLIALWESLVGDDSIYDLLDMEVQSETNDIISKVDGASLGESSVIMKDQIVEFMKYRAPVEISKGIIDRLKKSDASTTLTEADKNEELVESKEEYAEDEADLLEALFYSYKYIKKYQTYKASLTKLKDMASRLEQYRDLYKEINGYMVTNFANTEKLTEKFTRPTISLNKYKSSYKKSTKGIYSRKEKDESGTTVYYVDGDKIDSLLNDLERKITDFETKKTNVINKAGSYVNMQYGKGKNVASEIQWWVRVHDAVNDGSNSPIQQFKNAGDAMLKSYAKVLAMKTCELGDELPDDWETRYNNLTNKVVNYQDKYLKADRSNGGDNYLILVNKLEYISKNNITKVNPNNLTLSNGKTIGTTVSEIKSKLDSDKEHLKNCINVLNIVIKGDWTKKVKSLDKVKNLVKEYNQSFNTWKGNAESLKDPGSGGTQLGQDDWNEIQGIKSSEDKGQNDGKDRMINIKESDVTQLKTRLVNIRDQLQGMLDAINSVKYCGKKISSIDSFTTIQNAVKNKIGDVPLKNSELTSKSNELFNAQFKPSTSGALYTVNKDSAYNPDLTTSKPTLLKWMETKFQKEEQEIEEELKNKKSEVDGKKDEGDSDKAEEAQKGKEDARSKGVSKTDIYGNSDYAGSEFPSGLDKQSPYKLGSSIINGLATTITDLVNLNFTNSRDALYSTEYVMDMFSYSTYDNEGKYNLYKDINKKAPTSTAEYASVKDKWESKDITDTYNKTLTNKMINSENNVAFGAEVEYILYGNTNKKSVAGAYLDIFSVRYPLNTISGFQNFWGLKTNTGRAINTLANGIATATSGIIPAPLTKTVAILLLTALETAKDLDRLQDGFPVEVYKSADDWVYSIADNWDTSPDNDKVCENGLFYSDYLYLFLFLGFKGSSASEMYLRVGDVIQANMRKCTGSATYTLKNSHVYFKIDADIRVKPLMLAMPIAQGYSNNPSTASTDWCDFNVSEIRGYS